MGKNKKKEAKDYLIASRKKIGPGITNAPFWIIRKKGERIWNKRQKRHWRSTEFGQMFEKVQKKQKKRARGRKHYKKGKKNRDRR